MNLCWASLKADERRCIKAEQRLETEEKWRHIQGLEYSFPGDTSGLQAQICQPVNEKVVRGLMVKSEGFKSQAQSQAGPHPSASTHR